MIEQYDMGLLAGGGRVGQLRQDYLRAELDRAHEFYAEQFAELEKQLTDEKENHQGARECLDMVKKELENHGVKMDATPPMFYNDAIRHTIGRLLEEQRTRLAAEKARG